MERYALEWSADLLGLEFEGYSPTWRLGGKSQAVPQGHLIDLDNDAVGAERQVPALVVPVVYIFAYLIDV